MIPAITEKFPILSLTPQQAFKGISVAVATLCAFGSSWALFTTGMTIFCERALHPGSEHTWYNTRSFSFEKFFCGMGAVYLGKLFVAASWLALEDCGLVVLPNGPIQTKLAEIALADSAHFFFKVVVQGPICEEILYRGFLQERFVDIVELFDRHVYPLSNEFQEGIPSLAQAAVFGLAHITGNQVAPGAELLIATATGWSGCVWGICKIENKDLLLSTTIHSATNFIGLVYPK
ncbi:MAG: CPBP family intramembrane metalloprotease [Chlamydiales bacterium]|nr:CPBP family intramembrane metalloprotease [Chlamydiales bacterium]